MCKIRDKGIGKALKIKFKEDNLRWDVLLFIKFGFH